MYTHAGSVASDGTAGYTESRTRTAVKNQQPSIFQEGIMRFKILGAMLFVAATAGSPAAHAQNAQISISGSVALRSTLAAQIGG